MYCDVVETISGNQLRGHLETLVLSVLGSSDAHGFEILQRLERQGCGALALKEGTLYPVLYRLERQGLIKGRWEENPGGRRGPRRRVYRLVDQGHRELAHRRNQWRHFVNIIGGIVEPSPCT